MTTDPFTGRAETSRRRLLGAALAAGIALPIGLTGRRGRIRAARSGSSCPGRPGRTRWVPPRCT
jgi:hypothetical protein